MTVKMCQRRLKQTTLSILSTRLVRNPSHLSSVPARRMCSATRIYMPTSPAHALCIEPATADGDRYFVPATRSEGSPVPVPHPQQPHSSLLVHSFMNPISRWPVLIHGVVVPAPRTRGFCPARGLTCEGEGTTTGRWEPLPRSRRCAAAQPIS